MTQDAALHWVPVAHRADVPKNEGRRIRWGEHRIALFNLGDEFRAVEDRCPHKQGPLSDGIVAGRTVFCPLHNWNIDLASGCALSGGEGKVKTYPVRLEGEKVFLGFETREKNIPMKEVMAILRPGAWKETKRRLAEAGIYTLTERRVYGRGKQKGLIYLKAKKEGEPPGGVTFIPKRLVIIVLPETQAPTAVEAIIAANRTGAMGDGKIFVSPVDEVIHIRSGRREDQQKEVVLK
jgi:nitrite reductase (NADH) small subunit